MWLAHTDRLADGFKYQNQAKWRGICSRHLSIWQALCIIHLLQVANTIAFSRKDCSVADVLGVPSQRSAHILKILQDALCGLKEQSIDLQLMGFWHADLFMTVA